MTLHFRAFGDDAYVGPGSPGYNYATPEQVAAANVGETYVQPATNPYEYVTTVPQYLPAVQPQQDTSSSSGGVSDFFSSLVGGLFTPARQQSQRPPPPPMMPSWVIPAAIGGVALVLGAVMITSRRPSLAGHRRNRRRSKR